MGETETKRLYPGRQRSRRRTAGQKHCEYCEHREEKGQGRVSPKCCPRWPPELSETAGGRGGRRHSEHKKPVGRMAQRCVPVWAAREPGHTVTSACTPKSKAGLAVHPGQVTERSQTPRSQRGALRGNGQGSGPGAVLTSQEMAVWWRTRGQKWPERSCGKERPRRPSHKPGNCQEKTLLTGKKAAQSLQLPRFSNIKQIRQYYQNSQQTYRLRKKK